MQSTKKCSGCKKNLTLDKFGKLSSSKDGLRGKCRECRKVESKLDREKHGERRRETTKLWLQKNQDKVQEDQKLYYLKNTDKIKSRVKEYRKNNKERRNKHERNRYQNDICYKLRLILRNRINNVLLRGAVKENKHVKDLGCTAKELKLYIESMLWPGMTIVEGKKQGWELDHIIPLGNVDLTDVDVYKRVSHYTNIQPLWTKDHKEKPNYDGTNDTKFNIGHINKVISGHIDYTRSLVDDLLKKPSLVETDLSKILRGIQTSHKITYTEIPKSMKGSVR